MNLLAYSETQNQLDLLIYQDSLYFFVFLIAAFIGLLVGWVLWRNCRETCERVETENRQLVAKLKATKDAT